MVNDHEHDEVDFDVEREDHHDEYDIELSEEEGAIANKLKQLRQKITRLDEEKRAILEAAQLEKADFLNARKRLDTERAKDSVRFTKRFVEALLPISDSFEMARADKEGWERADQGWRKGMEGIEMQLNKLIASYGVAVIDPLGQPFDPRKHEAIGTVPVTDKAKDDTVVSVLQRGYEIQSDDTVEVIRPARVTIGAFTEDLADS